MRLKKKNIKEYEREYKNKNAIKYITYQVFCFIVFNLCERSGKYWIITALGTYNGYVITALLSTGNKKQGSKEHF